MYKILTFEQAYTASKNDVIAIGPLPVNENPADIIGVDGNLEMVNVYIQQLIRRHGKPPTNCDFFVLKVNDHTPIGYSYEAALSYPSDNNQSINYALAVECGDLFWDKLSIAALSNPKLGMRIVRKIDSSD